LIYEEKEKVMTLIREHDEKVKNIGSSLLEAKVLVECFNSK